MFTDDNDRRQVMGKNSSELKKCKNATKDYTYTGV
jgi:hypothetical protein